MKLSENMHEVDKTMKSKSKPLPVCCLPSALNIKHVEPQLSVDCPSLVGRDKGEAMAAAEEHAPNPASGTLKMQTSDACLKKFVIFDHCEGQNTVILHPSWLQGLPHQSSVEPGSMWEVNRFLDSFQVFNSKPVEAMFGFHSQAAAPSPAFGDVRGPALQGQLNSSKCDLIDVASCEAHNLKKEVFRTTMHLDFEQESLSSEFHENTEEINALLSSDDELSSTGHSPSDGASYCYGETMNGHSTNIIGRKRKLEDSPVDEVDDADSGSGKLAPGHSPLNIGRFGNPDFLQFPVLSAYKSIQSGVGLGHTSGKNTASSTFNVSEQANANQGQCKSNQSSGMSGEGGLADSSKKIKIKGNVQQLKNVIPGGNHLDTAGVLGRTIHYVKCLQNKLRGLEVARESERGMHQLNKLGTPLPNE